jgi:Tn3 transposase DDE domain
VREGPDGFVEQPHQPPDIAGARDVPEAPGATNINEIMERLTCYAQLAWTQSWYVSEENYRAALATLVNDHHALPLAAAWGAGTTSSSDGQYFRGQRGGLTERSPP